MNRPIKNLLFQGTLDGTPSGGTVDFSNIVFSVATQSGGDNTTKPATTAFVQDAITTALDGLDLGGHAVEFGGDFESEDTVFFGGAVNAAGSILLSGFLSTGGNVTFSGSDAVVLTVPSGGSSATLPTTGTIATTADVASAVTGLQEIKGSLDCSANPNYPAASNGDAYRVSVAGRIGGASGKQVSVGDMIIAFADNAGGTQAAVGASWNVGEGNIEGLTSFGVSLVTSANAATGRTVLGLVIGTDVQAYSSNLATFAGITLGSGVAAALAQNIYDSGSVVLYGDDAGTPSAIDLSYAIGLPLDSGVAGTLAIANGGTGGTSASQAATNLGLGTGDSPRFTAVNIGHATDTTLARVSAGVLSVEGVQLATVVDLYSERILVIREDFVGGTNTDGQIGQLGWRTGNLSGSGGSGAYVVNAAAAGHPGVYVLTTAAVFAASVPDARGIWLAGSGVAPVSILDPMEVRISFQLSSVSNVAMKIGLTNDNTVFAPTRGEYLSFDTSLGDTNFMAVTKDGGAETRTSTGVAATTGWFTVKIRCISSTSIGFSVSSAGGAFSSEVTLAQTNVGVVRFPLLSVANGAAAAKSLSIDYYTIYSTLTR